MNKNAQKWINALKSSKFKKSKGQLHYEENGKHYYCCLGVACELYQKETHSDSSLPKLLIQKFSINEKGISKIKFYNYDGCSGYLPEKVVNWLGLKDCSGTFNNTSLIKLNDTDDDPDIGNPEPDFSFKEIANIIENNANLFKEV